MTKKRFYSSAVPVLLTAAMMLFGMGTTALAATKDPIKDVSIEVKYDLSHGMSKSDVDVECNSDGVSDINVSGISNTEYGKRPKVTLKLKAEREYSFKGISKSNVTLSGDEAYVTKTNANNSTMTVTLTLPKIGSTNESALEVGDVSWSDDDDGSVEWEQASDADKYEVKLLRGSSTKNTITTSNTEYDFRSDIRANGKGNYTVKVRAIAGSYKGQWTESDDFDVDEDVLKDLGGKISRNSGNSSNNGNGGPGNKGSQKGAWLKDNNGWWYCNADRSYTTNNWQEIDGYWYYFNQHGYMKSGWLESPFSHKWYWLSTANDSSYGRMLTSQWVDNGKYYVDANGVWDGQARN